MFLASKVRAKARLPSICTKRCSLTAASPQQDKKQEQDQEQHDEIAIAESTRTQNQKQTMAEADEELRLKMAGLAGDGGEAGVELEDGQPVSMKRSVRENMFRYI